MGVLATTEGWSTLVDGFHQYPGYDGMRAVIATDWFSSLAMVYRLYESRRRRIPYRAPMLRAIPVHRPTLALGVEGINDLIRRANYRPLKFTLEVVGRAARRIDLDGRDRRTSRAGSSTRTEPRLSGQPRPRSQLRCEAVMRAQTVESVGGRGMMLVLGVLTAIMLAMLFRPRPPSPFSEHGGFGAGSREPEPDVRRQPARGRAAPA